MRAVDHGGSAVQPTETPVAPLNASDLDTAHLRLLWPVGPLSLGYVREGDNIALVARDRSARWPTEVLREGTAALDVDGQITRGSAELITDEDAKSRILALFRTKYGEQQFVRWYARPARVLRIVTAPAADPPGRVEHYHQWLAAEFDNVAEDYDRHITGNRINRLLRDRSLAELRRAFSSAHHLLEVGCGSGMETLPLLEDGHEVLCVDISERMLDVVRRKAHAAGRSESLRTLRLSAADLSRVNSAASVGTFDGAYSTYGAMNCEEDLKAVPPALFGLLRPAAPFVAGVYNRWCLFELVGYGMTGRWSRAFGRAHSPVPVGSSRFCVDIYAYSAVGFRRLFDPWFRAERLQAVPAILPPSDLVEYAERFGRRWETLAQLDRSLARRWPFRALGDHFLLTFSRRATPEGGAA